MEDSIIQAVPNPNQSCQSDHGDHDDHDDNSDFPVVIMHQILIKLPLKQIFKFKSVSKRWNSYISSPAFSQSYTRSKQLGPSNSPPWTLLLCHYGKRDMCHALSSAGEFSGELTISGCDFVKYRGKSHETGTKQQRISLLPKDDSQIRCRDEEFMDNPYAVVSSSHGLLLCWLSLLDTYAILNPLTREWYDIPRFGFCCRSCAEHGGFVTRVDESGSKVTNFKVICLQSCDFTRNRHNNDLVLYFYDSDIKTWVESSIDFLRHDLIRPGKKPVCFNNIIHWECTSGDIFAYDPYDQGCRLIFARDEATYAAISVLGASNGRLRYLENNSGGFRLWVLEDYDEGRWELGYEIMFDEIESIRGAKGGQPIALHPFDSNIIVFLKDSTPKKLISYNVSNGLVSYSPSDLSAVYTSRSLFPFVLPVWPTIMDDSISNTHL